MYGKKKINENKLHVKKNNYTIKPVGWIKNTNITELSIVKSVLWGEKKGKSYWLCIKYSDYSR